MSYLEVAKQTSMGLMLNHPYWFGAILLIILLVLGILMFMAAEWFEHRIKTAIYAFIVYSFVFFVGFLLLMLFDSGEAYIWMKAVGL